MDNEPTASKGYMRFAAIVFCVWLAYLMTLAVFNRLGY
jgi:hypothetical protein